jgi:hypothetical protein
MTEEIDLLEGVDFQDINSVIKKFTELQAIRKKFEDTCEDLKVKIKIFMKEKKWNSYKHDNINVNISRIEQTSIDKDKLKLILTKQQLESISKMKVIEKIMITTKEQRDRMSRFVNGK